MKRFETRNYLNLCFAASFLLSLQVLFFCFFLPLQAQSRRVYIPFLGKDHVRVEHGKCPWRASYQTQRFNKQLLNLILPLSSDLTP